MGILDRILARQPRVAMVVCVRNEARFIAANLLYHRAIGVERAYVFLDRCTDESEQIVSSLPWVLATRVNPDDAARFQYVADLQRCCMDRALALARQERFDWLLAIDPDEFAVTTESQRTGITPDLRGMLSRVPRRIEVVRLPSEEVLPRDLSPDEPFWKQRYFMTGESVRRRTLNTSDGTIVEWNGRAGHVSGKSLVRATADVQAMNSHGWTRNQGIGFPRIPGDAPIRTLHTGGLLHFVIVDWRQWHDKYRKFAHVPDTWRGGKPVRITKRIWKRAARQLNPEQAREYFRRWVATPVDSLQKLSVTGEVREVDVVERTLRSSGNLVGTSLILPGQATFPAIEEWDLPAETWQDPSRLARIEGPGGRLRFQVADLQCAQAEGMYAAEYDGRHRFRWTAPVAEMRLEFAPGDYMMTLHIQRRTRWRRPVAISIDGNRLPDHRCVFGKYRVTVALSAEDLAPTSSHVLHLAFAAPPNTGQRPLGAALHEISLKPIGDHKAA